MIIIKEVEENSQSYNKGIRKNDIIEKINGYKAIDQLDLLFYSNFETIELKIRNKGVFKLDTNNLGIKPEEFDIRRCNNNCIFCFVSQMPSNCRNSLYIKDDDYRMSFLYGAYITLNNMKEEDYERIGRLNLSPLYISVHTVDKDLRAKILRSKRVINIKKKIKKLINMNINLHTQLVLMPGINDSNNLIESLDFLTNFYSEIQTISIVPVGLTRFRDKLYPLREYTVAEAEEVIDIAEKYQKEFLKKYGEPVVYITDEFYIKAKRKFPDSYRYEIYEDGVGMYVNFKTEFEDNINLLTQKNFDNNKKIGIITSVDGKKILSEFVEKLNNFGININLISVRNNFFGESVTGTGLLTGIDIKNTIQDIKENYDLVIIPDVVLNEDNLLLDDYHKNDLIDIKEIEIQFIKTNAKSLIEKVAK